MLTTSLPGKTLIPKAEHIDFDKVRGEERRVSQQEGAGYSRERCVFSIVFLSISARNASLTPRDSKYGPKSTKHIFAQS